MAVPAPSRRFAVVAIVVAYALIEAALWTRGRTQLAWSGVAALWMVWSMVRQRRTARELGTGWRGLLPSLWVIPFSIGICALMMWTASRYGTLHGLYGPNPVLYHSFGYAIWAIEQEFILQSFFYLNLEEVIGNRPRTAVVAAMLFAAAHIPNPLLVAATLAVGICLTQVFRRHRNIYALGVAHGLLGLALAISVPDNVHHHMRVGIGYLTYRPSSTVPTPPMIGVSHHD